MTTIKRALLAPFDKSGLEDFARALHERGVEFLATSGTAKKLREAELPVTEVQRDDAERQTYITFVGQLAAQSLARLNTQLDLAALLGIEANEAQDNLQTRNSLLQSLLVHVGANNARD